MMLNRILLHRYILNGTGKLFLKRRENHSYKLLHINMFSNSNIFYPGKVSPVKSVPLHIHKPPYANNNSWFSTAKYTKYNFPPHAEIKSPQMISSLRDSCKLSKEILQYAGSLIQPGISTDEIDIKVHEEIVRNNAYPSPLRYRGFPKSICTSVNNVACHGIPDDRKLMEGDIVNVDITVFYDGMHGDCSETFLVGEVSADNEWLCEVTKQCRDRAIEACGPNIPFNIIGKSVSEHAKEWGFSVVADFCGHGIGSYFHGLPTISHIENSDVNPMLPGMAFTIEPILSSGGSEVKVLSDEWTAVTKDNSFAAQFEHTVLITDHGVDILTQ